MQVYLHIFVDRFLFPSLQAHMISTERIAIKIFGGLKCLTLKVGLLGIAMDFRWELK